MPIKKFNEYILIIFLTIPLAQIDDVCVTGENMDTLKIGGKIDDTIIHFLCCLEAKRFENQMQLYKFVSPLVTQLLQTMSIEQAAEFLESASFKSYDTIFFPLSNLKSEVLGHWSLLIWCRKMKNKFLHFDSLKNVNIVPAKNLTEKIVKCCQLKSYKFKNMKSPHQNNNTDCGVYLMAIMDEIATTKKISDLLITKINQEYINRFRFALMSCIMDQSSSKYDWEKYHKLLIC